MDDVIVYGELADDIALETGGIPEHIVLQVIPRAVQEFCSESRCLQDTLTAQVANGQVHFGTTDELEPVGILAVRYGEVLANADTARGVFNDVGSGIRYTVKGTKNGHGRVLSVTFNGVKNPSTTDTVRALVYFAPTRDSVECEIPRDSGLFLRAISALVMAKLYVMPNRPWTDLGQSQYHYGIYADLLVQAKRQAKSNDIPVVRECKFSW